MLMGLLEDSRKSWIGKKKKKKASSEKYCYKFNIYKNRLQI